MAGTPSVLSRVVVRAAIAPLMSAARVSSGQASQLLRGHGADVLEEDGKWRRLLGADGYQGWSHAGYLAPSHDPHTSLASAWSAERRMSVGCVVRAADGTTIRLPLGALLDPDEELVEGLAMNRRARERYFAAEREAIVVRGMEQFRGAPYQWGGVTPWGADCSGFVQTMFALHGTQLPRDAWMQAERGREVAGDLDTLVPADLLFFSDREDGRVTHVAISTGGAGVIHMSLANGGFGADDLRADDDVAANLRATFRFARRIV